MANLPDDVWGYIAQFIPTATLRNLYGVNSSLLAISMAIRYHTIVFDKYDKYTKQLCRRLGDPRVGNLVRCVEINPWLVQPRVIYSYGRLSKLWTRVNEFLAPGYAEQHAKDSATRKMEKVLSRITTVMGGMQNVAEYRVEWDENRRYHSEFYRAFLNPTLNNFRETLVDLYLKVPLAFLPSLVSVSLPRLEHLEITFSTQATQTKEIDDTLDPFVIFVNNLCSSLEGLSVVSTSSSVFLDLSHFFKHLGRFPLLRGFSLCIPFDGAHLSDPTTLSNFLDTHRPTLQDFRLSTCRSSVRQGPLDSNCKYWIRSVMSSTRGFFPRLHTLEVALRPLKADLTPLTVFLQAYAGQLSSLTLRDRALTYEDVGVVLDIFARLRPGESILTTLRIRVHRLTPELMDRLAYGLPGLKDLELAFIEVIFEEPSYEDHYRFLPRAVKLGRFGEKMRSRIYENWALNRITIPENPGINMGEVEQILRECIPHLESVIPPAIDNA